MLVKFVYILQPSIKTKISEYCICDISFILIYLILVFRILTFFCNAIYLFFKSKSRPFVSKNFLYARSKACPIVNVISSDCNENKTTIKITTSYINAFYYWNIFSSFQFSETVSFFLAE